MKKCEKKKEKSFKISFSFFNLLLREKIAMKGQHKEENFTKMAHQKIDFKTLIYLIILSFERYEKKNDKKKGKKASFCLTKFLQRFF